MKISIIIPTYNRKKVLRHTVLALINQNIDDYEVIVCDDGSDDNTDLELEDIKKNFSLPFSLEYCRQERNGFRAGQARNLGIDRAKGEIIFFIDQDIIAQPGALFAIASKVVEKKVILAKRKLVPLDFYENLITDDIVLNDFNQFEKQEHGVINASLSCFGAITKKDLDIVEGFDADFCGWGFEDTELMQRLEDVQTSFERLDNVYGYHIAHVGNAYSRQSKDIYFHKRNHRTGTGKRHHDISDSSNS